MCRLIVIGNGFDLAHGLPTNYCDFMKYLLAYEIQPLFFGEPNYACQTSVLSHTQAKHHFYKALNKYIPEQALWCSFENALALLDEEQLQDDNSSYLLGYGDEHWHESAHHDFQNMIGEALSFSLDIPMYLRQWICCIDTHVPPSIYSNIINNNCLFLTFNYTDTLESSYGISSERILYIHGKARRWDNLILGHHNNTLFQDNSISKFQPEEEGELYYENYPDDVRIMEAKELIKAYFRGTYKDTTSIIQKNQAFFYSLKGISEVYILGHSLSSIDFEYFYEIKKHVPLTCQWNISYYSKCDYSNAQNLISALDIQNYHLFHTT